MGVAHNNSCMYVNRSSGDDYVIPWPLFAKIKKIQSNMKTLECSQLER